MGTRATSSHDGTEPDILSDHDANGKEPRSMKEGYPDRRFLPDGAQQARGGSV